MCDYPKISIITPTYNASKYIEACLDSVCNQNYPNLEYIIVDGLSKDNTMDLVKSKAEQFPFIKLVTEKDKGIYDAMNKGISLATGDFLYFLGADDVLCEDLLNDITSKVLFSNFDIVYGKVKYPTIEFGKEINWEEIKKQNFIIPFVHLYIHHQGAFISKKLFDIYGDYELKYPIGADIIFFIKTINQQEVRLKFVDIYFANLCDEGVSSYVEDIFIRFEFPALANQYLNLIVDKKMYYRNLSKYYFHEIYQGELKKGFKRIWKILLFTGDFGYLLRNTIYWLRKRNINK